MKKIYFIIIFAGLLKADVFAQFQGGQGRGDVSISALPLSECTPPSIEASNGSVQTITHNSATITWTNGNGTAGRLVVVRPFNEVNISPFSGLTYSADNIFGMGYDWGWDNYLVYNSTGNSVNVTNLLPLHLYYYKIFEYNSVGNCYSSVSLSGSFTTGLDPNVSCIGSYVGSSQSIAYSSIIGTGGTTVIANGDGIDDQNYSGISFPVGFTFSFNGSTYNSLGISANGFVWFGSGQPGATYAAYGGTPIGSASANLGGSGTITAILAAVGADLIKHDYQNALPLFQIVTKMNGTAPNRYFTIEWAGFLIKSLSGGNNICSATESANAGWTPGLALNHHRLDFQIRLYENNLSGSNPNRIEYLYRQQPDDPYTNPPTGWCTSNAISFQAGIRGSNNTEFLTRSNTGSLTSSSTTLGADANALINISGNSNIPANVGIRFQPNSSVPIVNPSPTASNTCPAVTATLSSNSAVNNQWFKDGELIPSATAQNYNATETGNFFARVNYGSCNAASQNVAVTITPCVSASTWTGTTSVDWNTPINWDPVGIPASGSDIIIPTIGVTHNPTISSFAANVGDIEIQSGRTLTIASNASLTVEGEINNNGVITINSGGALVQTVGSTLAGTGTYNVRRQIPGSGIGSRFIGSPIDDIAANGISGITATGVDGAQILPLSDCNPNAIAPGSPYGNILELREIPEAQVIHDCSQSLWFVKSAGLLENVRGYSVRANGGQTITFSGTRVNNGDRSLTGLIRETGVVYDHIAELNVTRGWQLVSNPYPSPIAIPVNYLSGQDFDNQVHLWNSATGTWTSTIATSGNPVIIAVGQGFEIRKSLEAGASDLSFTNALRVANTGVTYFGADEFGDYRLRIDLKGNNYEDKTTVFFHPDATPAFDPIFDINKMIGSSTSPALFTMAGMERMAYNGLPLLNEPITVPMVFYPGTNGTYTLDFSQLETLPSTAMVYLEDKKTGVWTNVRAQNAYTFTSITSDNIQRFNIHFEPPMNINSISESCQLNDGIINIINPSNETWSVSVESNGNEVYQNNISQGEISISNLVSGVYTLNFTNNTYTVSEEITIEAGTPVEANFTLSNETFQVFDIVTATVQNPVDNTSYAWYLNDLYAGVGTTTNFAISDMGTYTISLDAVLGTCKSSSSSSFQVEGTTSISHLEKDNFLRAYPNPANELVTIVWNEKAVNYELVRIMDISGRTVQSIQLGSKTQGNQLQLDLTNISEGMYLISLEGTDVRRTVKVSVVK